MSDAKLKVRREFPRPSPETVAAIAKAASGHLVDAQGRRGAMAHAIRPLTVKARFCGPALTVWTAPRDNFAPYAALKFAKPGDVLVVATGGEDEVSVLGDVLVAMAKNAGVAAIVTDGLVRDVDGIDAVGIPVFARGQSPNSPLKNGPGEIGGQVALGRLVVNAGDILLGDRDGVVVAPRADAETLPARLEAVYAKERMMEAKAAGGAQYPDWLDAALEGDDIEWLES